MLVYSRGKRWMTLMIVLFFIQLWFKRQNRSWGPNVPLVMMMIIVSMMDGGEVTIMKSMHIMVSTYWVGGLSFLPAASTGRRQKKKES